MRLVFVLFGVSPFSSLKLLRVRLLVALALVGLSGCTDKTARNSGDKPAASNSSSASSQTAPAPTGKTASSTAATNAASPTATVDNEVRKPATVAEAAKILDLSTFPMLEGVEDPGERVVAGLYYQAPGTVKEAFESQRKELTTRGWKEQAHTYMSDQSSNASFARQGYYVSLSVMEGSDPGTVAVRLQNHSNVNLSKLSVPPGAKLQYSFPAVTAFVTDAGVEETADALRKLLLDDGWEPYGSAGDSMYFLQHGVKLDARVMSPPAQPGKTTIDFSAQQLSAEIPAPPDAESVQYADGIKQLSVDAPGAPQDIVKFYAERLAAAGWKQTTENLIQDGFKQSIYFVNGAKELLSFSIRDLENGKTRYTVQHQTRAEVDEIDNRIKEQLAEKKRKEDEEASRPKPKFSLAIPKAARDVEAKPTEIAFKVRSGTAKGAVDQIIRQLESEGWKTADTIGDDMAGQMTFTKGEQSISILYVDPSLIPGEITITATGLELESKAAE